MKMVEFSVDSYSISVSVGERPTILDYYKERASLIDDEGLKQEGTEVYIIISKGLPEAPFLIIAFRTEPVGYAGFNPSIHYEKDTQILFIGAGAIIKTIRLTDNKLIFEKNNGFGFWTWKKHNNFILQLEEIDFGVFNSEGEQLWQTNVSPPYDFEIIGNKIALKFDDAIKTRLLSTGEEA